MVEKTELEKRWESLEEDVKDLVTKADGIAEDIQHEEISPFIDHPLCDDPETVVPLAIVSFGNRVIIGGIIDIDAITCEMLFPLAYIEFFDDPTGGSKPQPQLLIKPLMFTVENPETMIFKWDSVYRLKKDSKNDNKILIHYENTLHQLLGKDRIVAPTVEETSKILLGR